MKVTLIVAKNREMGGRYHIEVIGARNCITNLLDDKESQKEFCDCYLDKDHPWRAEVTLLDIELTKEQLSEVESKFGLIKI